MFGTHIIHCFYVWILLNILSKKFALFVILKAITETKKYIHIKHVLYLQIKLLNIILESMKQGDKNNTNKFYMHKYINLFTYRCIIIICKCLHYSLLE